MKSTIVPAQITTVEDKIAGSLSLGQIIILLIPVMWTGIVYVVFPSSLEFTLYKVPLIILVSVMCILSSIRLKGKLVATWFGIVLHYYLRPRYYVADKNEVYLRDIVYPKISPAKISTKLKSSEKSQNAKVSIPAYEELLPTNFALNFKFDKKGIYAEKI